MARRSNDSRLATSVRPEATSSRRNPIWAAIASASTRPSRWEEIDSDVATRMTHASKRESERDEVAQST